jgi:hypothetical protein
MAKKSRSVAIVLIVVGALLMMAKLGWIPSLGHLFSAWWPMALVLVGIMLLFER